MRHMAVRRPEGSTATTETPTTQEQAAPVA
jgi:hypothetical protein